MCDQCKTFAWHTLRTWCEGEADISHIDQAKVTKGWMFQDSVIRLFARNLPRLTDKDHFKRWWGTNTIGPERDPKEPSINKFLFKVMATFNELKAAKMLASMRGADAETAPAERPPVESLEDRSGKTAKKAKKAKGKKGAKKPDAPGKEEPKAGSAVLTAEPKAEKVEAEKPEE
jgi:hypothetical protein